MSLHRHFHIPNRRFYASAFAIRRFCSHKVPLLFPPVRSLSFAESDPEGIPSCSISSIFFHRRNATEGQTIISPLRPTPLLASGSSLPDRCPPSPSIAIDITIASSASKDSHRRIGSFRARQRRLVIPKVLRRLRSFLLYSTEILGALSIGNI